MFGISGRQVWTLSSFSTWISHIFWASQHLGQDSELPTPPSERVVSCLGIWWFCVQARAALGERSFTLGGLSWFPSYPLWIEMLNLKSSKLKEDQVCAVCWGVRRHSRAFSRKLKEKVATVISTWDMDGSRVTDGIKEKGNFFLPLLLSCSF